MNIKKNEVHLWFACESEIDPERVSSAYRALLSDEERQKSDSFYFEKHRHQHIVTRALVRSVLSKYVTHINPNQWRFNRNEWGKPYIANSEGDIPNIKFNISHCEGLVILALAVDADIGVDVEDVWREIEISLIADSVFSSIEKRYMNLVEGPARKDLFWDIWTLKEAYIKALGKGLSIPLQSISFDLADGHTILPILSGLHQGAGFEMQFWQIGLEERYKVALAVRTGRLGEDMHIHFYEAFSGDVFRNAGPSILRRSGRCIEPSASTAPVSATDTET